MSVRLVTGVALALLVTVGTSQAQESASTGSDRGNADRGSSTARERAKARFSEATAAYRDGRYKDAIDLFLETDALSPSPLLSFNIARAYGRLGDAANELRWYRDYLRKAPDASDRAAVEKRIVQLEGVLRQKGVQQVTIESDPRGATIVLDRRPVGVTPWTGEIPPGKHVFRLRLQGFEQVEVDFRLSPERAVFLAQRLIPASRSGPPSPVTSATREPAPDRPSASAPGKPPADRPEPERGLGLATWISFGVGAAALGGALGFELARASAEEDARQAPQVSFQDAYDRAESHQTTARVLAGVGAAALVTGGVLLYLDLSSGSGGEEAAVGVACGSSECLVSVAGRMGGLL